MFTNSDWQWQHTIDSTSEHPASGRPLQLGTPRLHLKPRFESLRGGSNLVWPCVTQEWSQVLRISMDLWSQRIHTKCHLTFAPRSLASCFVAKMISENSELRTMWGDFLTGKAFYYIIRKVGQITLHRWGSAALVQRYHWPPDLPLQTGSCEARLVQSVTEASVPWNKFPWPCETLRSPFTTGTPYIRIYKIGLCGPSFIQSDHSRFGRCNGLKPKTST